MESEIREQPALLSGNSAVYEAELMKALRGRQFDLIVLVARGSSDNAALYARYLFEVHLAIPTVLCARASSQDTEREFAIQTLSWLGYRKAGPQRTSPRCCVLRGRPATRRSP